MRHLQINAVISIWVISIFITFPKLLIYYPPTGGFDLKKINRADLYIGSSILDSCIFINGDNVNVRTEGNSKAPVLEYENWEGKMKNVQLNTGDYCRLLEVGEDEAIGSMKANWLRVEYHCITGWVYGAFTVNAVENKLIVQNDILGRYISYSNNPELCGGDGYASSLFLRYDQDLLKAYYLEEVEGWDEPNYLTELSDFKVNDVTISSGRTVYYSVKSERSLKNGYTPTGFFDGREFFETLEE